jgi:hypothetical protein
MGRAAVSGNSAVLSFRNNPRNRRNVLVLNLAPEIRDVLIALLITIACAVVLSLLYSP